MFLYSTRIIKNPTRIINLFGFLPFMLFYCCFFRKRFSQISTAISSQLIQYQKKRRAAWKTTIQKPTGAKRKIINMITLRYTRLCCMIIGRFAKAEVRQENMKQFQSCGVVEAENIRNIKKDLAWIKNFNTHFLLYMMKISGLFH